MLVVLDVALSVGVVGCLIWCCWLSVADGLLWLASVVVWLLCWSVAMPFICLPMTIQSRAGAIGTATNDRIKHGLKLSGVDRVRLFMALCGYNFIIKHLYIIAFVLLTNARTNRATRTKTSRATRTQTNTENNTKYI